MSRDIGDSRWASPRRSPRRLGPRPSAGVLSLVAPVGSRRLDAVGREDLAGPEGDDGDLARISDGQDPFAGMGGPDPQVVQASGPAQRDPAAPVDEVVAESEVTGGAAPGRVGLWRRPVGFRGGVSADGSVRSLLVVGQAEGIELGLQLGEGPGGGLSLEPALERLVEALDVALCLQDVSGPRSAAGCRARRAGTRRRCACLSASSSRAAPKCWSA